VFTAGTTPGTYTNTVRATSGGITGSATVTVAAGALATIAVSPNPTTVTAGGTQTFTAVGRDAAGNVVALTPTWSVGAGGGTITAAGVFTAGTTPGTYTNTVRATSGGITGSATVTVSAAAPSIGALQVLVTGLTGPLVNGGSAVAQRTDLAGTPITISVSATGTGSNSNVPAGTYSVTYTPPSGWSITSTNPVTGRVVTAGGTTTATFAAAMAGTFVTPNILNNESFEAGWDGWTDASGGLPTTTRDNTMPPAPGGGSWAVGASVANAYYFRRELPGGPYDELWFRAYVRFSAGFSVTSQGSFWKFWRYRIPAGNAVGGGFDMTGSGLEFGSYQECASHFATVIPNSLITGNTWHTLEWHYKRNGDALPWAEFWWDNALITHADGPAGYNGCLYWSGDRLYMGWPSNRGAYVQLRSIDMVGTADNVTGTGMVWIDRVAASTLGRIGP
jgi:hypothetical protein